MTLSELNDIIEGLYTEIVTREEVIKKEMILNGDLSNGERLSQEYLDYDDIYSELKDILLPVLNNYNFCLKSNIREKILKVYFVAICEMIKHDFNRGMIITFRATTGVEFVNYSKYYSLLNLVSTQEKMHLSKAKGRYQYEQSYILETGVPKNLTKDVLKMFQIYWRYFRNINKRERFNAISDFINGNDFSKEYIIEEKDFNNFKNNRDKVKEFPEKVKSVFEKFEKIFIAFDEYDNLLDLNSSSFGGIIKEINKKIGFKIENVLRHSDLEKIYFSYISKVTIPKFEKILHNLNKNEYVINPKGSIVSVYELNTKSIWCGAYSVRGIKYKVVIDPVIDIEEMLCYTCNIIHMLSNDYYLYSSREDFEVEIDYKIMHTRYLYYDGQERYIWIGKVPPASKGIIDGKVLKSLLNYSINHSIVKYFDRITKKNKLKILISKFKINSINFAYKKIEISINDGDMITLGYADDRGIFLLEYKYIDLKEIYDEYFIKIHVNNEEIGIITDKISSFLLYDKWNGVRYKEDVINESHSGALVCFSKELFQCSNQIEIEEQYKFLDYYVTVFICKDNKRNLEINTYKWLFTKANKPYILLQQEGLYEDNVANKINDVVFKIYNLVENHTYHLNVENSTYNFRSIILKENYNIEVSLHDLLENRLNNNYSGKWFISLWDTQKKVDEVNIYVIPKLHIKQKKNVVLEDNEVNVIINSEIPCFYDGSGVLTNEIEYLLGVAKLEVIGGLVSAPELNSVIYNDRFEIAQEIRYSPCVWGLRIKDYVNDEWLRDLNINLNKLTLENKNCVICSTRHFMANVNGEEMNISPGFNNIKWYKYFDNYAPKNEILVYDGQCSKSFILGLFSNIEFHDAVYGNNACNIKFSYTGPMNEQLIIRTYIDGRLVKTKERVAHKNKFYFHYNIEDIEQFSGKKIKIEYISNHKKIPEMIYEGIITYSHSKTDRNNDLKLYDYLKVDKLIEKFYFGNKREIDIEADIKDIIQKIISS